LIDRDTSSHIITPAGNMLELIGDEEKDDDEKEEERE
jgi:hypothetical protein